VNAIGKELIKWKQSAEALTRSYGAMPVVSVFTFLVVQPCFIPHTAPECKMIAPFAYHAKKANFSSFVN